MMRHSRNIRFCSSEKSREIIFHSGDVLIKANELKFAIQYYINKLHLYEKFHDFSSNRSLTKKLSNQRKSYTKC